VITTRGRSGLPAGPRMRRDRAQIIFRCRRQRERSSRGPTSRVGPPRLLIAVNLDQRPDASPHIYIYIYIYIYIRGIARSLNAGARHCPGRRGLLVRFLNGIPMRVMGGGGGITTISLRPWSLARRDAARRAGPEKRATKRVKNEKERVGGGGLEARRGSALDFSKRKL